MQKIVLTLLGIVFSGLIWANSQNGPTNQTDAQGRKQGHWVITGAIKATPGYKPDQVIEEGDYLDNRKTGLWTAYHTNGNKKSEIEYKNNRPNGKFITYYDNGKVEEEGTWKNNVYQGSFKRYYPNGQVAQEKNFNTAGKTEGKVTYWYSNGKKEMEFESKNGVEDGQMTRYYENGDVKETKNFAGGKVEDGTEKEFKMVNPPVKLEDPAGLEKKTTSVDPNLKTNAAQTKVKDGYNKLYDDQNRLVQDGEFKGGRLWNGKLYKYDKNGLLLKIEMYKEGKYIGDGQIDSF